MKKPTASAIRAAVPLTEIARASHRSADLLRCCNVCGHDVDPLDLPLTVWREHDERDKPIAGNVALVFLGQGSDHAACAKTLDKHPRLYAEESGQPGHFPSICGPCVFRDGLSCGHADLKANGGAGLSVTLDGLNAIVCTRGSGCFTPIKHATKCKGRRVLAMLEKDGAA